MNIIGLVGFIGSGKDTVAKILTQNGCVQDSFASPLKELCASVFGWPLEMLQGDTVESRDFRETPDIFWSRKLGIDHFTPRLALQLLGTEVMRDHFNQDIWINSLEYRLRMKNADYPCVVISDARFQNELSLIKSMNGTVIWVQRGELPDWYETAKTSELNVLSRKIMQTRYKDGHESEWNGVGVEPDYIIKNEGTLEDLESKVAHIHTEIIRNTKTSLKIV